MPKDKYSIELEVRKIGEGLEQVKREMHALGNQVRTEGGKIRAETSRLDDGFKRVSSTISNVKRLLIGLGALMIARRLVGDFLDAARSVEQMQLRLKALLGSAEEGKKLFDDLADFAAKVPFELEEIMDSATTLAGIMKGGRTEIMAWMPLIADLAAVTNLSIETVTVQIMRMLSAGAASADLFRERGVLAMLGFTAGVSYSAEETRKKLWEAWASSESRFRGATQDMAKSWDGMISMLRDSWFQLRKKVMEAGVFDFMKAGIELVLQKIEDLKEQGRLDKWAKEMAETAITALKAIALAAAGVVDAFQGMEIMLLGIQGLFHTIAYEASLFLANLFGLLNKIPGLTGRFTSMIADALHDAERALDKMDKVADKIFAQPESRLLRIRALFKEIEAEIEKLGTAGAGAGAAPGEMPGGGGGPEEWTEAMIRAEALVGPWLQDRYEYELDYADAIRETNALLKEQAEKVLPALRKQLEAQVSALEDFYGVTDTQLQDIVVRHRQAANESESIWGEMSDSVKWSLEAGLFDVFKNGFNDLEGAAKSFLEMLAESFARAVAKMISEWIALKAVMGLVSAVGSMFGGGGAGGIGYEYQHGGIIPEPVGGFGLRSKRPYLFGEAGPEMVTPMRAFSPRRELIQNIYILDKREKISGLTDNDVVLVVSDNIQKDGVIRKTIKRFT